VSSENEGGRPPGNGDGPQDRAIALARDCPAASPQNPPQAKQEVSPADRRTSRTGLSVSVRDLRVRLALDDIWHAVAPVSRHSDATMLCLELEDFAGLEHHLRLVVGGVRKAAQKHRELIGLLSSRARTKAEP
jgi:hypothetical protein